MNPSALKLASADVTDAAKIWASLSDEEQRMVSTRRRMVDEWRRSCRVAETTGETMKRATEVFLGLHPELSRTTLYDWAKRRDDADPSALLDGRKARAGKFDPTFPSIGDAAWSCFLRYWLTTARRPVTLVYQIVKGAAAEHPGDPAWAWPDNPRTVQRRAAEIPETQADYYRLGEREWSRKHMQSKTRDYPEYRSGECWVGDFHEFDVFCRRSAEDPTIVRPLLGSFLDLRSCTIMGYLIGECETADAVLMTLADGVRRHGAPWQVIIDNGKPYRMHGVSGGRPSSKRLIEDPEDFRRRIAVLPGLHIAVHFSNPYRPNSKRVERWHRTLEDQFGKTFDSYCGGEHDDRFKLAWDLAHDHPEACPTIADVREKFTAWLETYHGAEHHGEGMDGLTPNEAFQRFDPVPRSVCPENVLEMLLLKTYNPRVKLPDGGYRYGVHVTKDGVRYQNIEYGSSDPRMWDLHGQWLPLRVHPTDASFVIVCDEQGRPLVKCINNKIALAGATRDDVSQAMKSQKHARHYAKKIREGAMQPLNRSTADLAIAGRAASNRQAAQRKLLAATGTGDTAPVASGDQPAVRNLAPLRNDFVAAVERFEARAAQPPAARPRRSLTELSAALREPPPAAEEDLVTPAKRRRDLLDLFGQQEPAAAGPAADSPSEGGAA